MMASPSEEETLCLSRCFGVPIHPEFNFFWERLEAGEYSILAQAFRNHSSNTSSVPVDDQTKRLLEKLGVEHSIDGPMIVITHGVSVLHELLSPRKGRVTAIYPRSVPSI